MTATRLSLVIVLALVKGLLAQPLDVVRVDARGHGTIRSHHARGADDGSGLGVLGALLTPIGAPIPTWTLLGHAQAWDSGGGTGPSTTAGFDTTGAKLIVIGASWLDSVGGAAGSVSDNKGNTWVKDTLRGANGNSWSCIFYCINPTVGAGHTFTLSLSAGNYELLAVQAWKTTGTIKFDQHNGANNASASSLATGAITPGTNGTLIVAVGGGSSTHTGESVGSGFTMTDTHDGAVNQNMCNGMAYLLPGLGAPASVNPTFSWSAGSDYASASICSFRNH